MKRTPLRKLGNEENARVKNSGRILYQTGFKDGKAEALREAVDILEEMEITGHASNFKTIYNRALSEAIQKIKELSQQQEKK